MKAVERQPGKDVDTAELIRIAEENGNIKIVEMLGKTLEMELISELVDAMEIIELLLESETIIEAVANDSGVRIRNNPTASNSSTIGSVDRGDEVIILGKSEREEKIQNMLAHWYKIKTEDSTVGYA